MASMMEYRRMLAERDLALVWPQWRIVRLLGAGSFGEVYEIQRDEYGLTSRCALKILRKENPAPMPGDSYGSISGSNSSEDFINTVIREIDIMQSLKGAPNIVVIDDYEIARSNDSCAVLIRMELLRNLRDYITSTQVTVNDIIRVGVDICNALEYCEGRNIIHRDVKESNIFYSDMGIFKLGDFGISKQLTDYMMNNATMTSAGTINKMAPEVYYGKHYDNRVDIYSLGVVLYSLLNYGRPPFYPPYPAQVTAEEAMAADMIRLQGTAVPPLAGVDSRLNKVICKACSPKPSGRYRTAAEFRSALESCYQGVGAGAKKKRIEPPVESTVDVSSSDRAGGGFPMAAGIALIAAIAVIVGGITAWYIGQGKGKPTYQPVVIAQNDPNNAAAGTVPGEEEPEEIIAEQDDDAQDAENTDTEKHYLEPEKEDEPEDEEEQYFGGGEGSAASIMYSLPSGNDNSGDGKAEENNDGTVTIQDDEGKDVAVVTKPSWASETEVKKDGVGFFNGDHTRYADVSFMKGASPATVVSFVKDALQGSEEYDEKEIEPDTEVTVNGHEAHYLRAVVSKDGVKNIIYWGAITCPKGSISVAMIASNGTSQVPDISDSDFVADLENVTIID